MAKADIVRKVTEFRDGKRPATVMHQIGKGYNDREIALIAEYFAAQKK
jgi:cytochrome c553